MNKNNRIVRMGIAVVLTVLMAGASTHTMTAAMDLPAGAGAAYLPALAAALLCGLGGLSGGMTIAAFVAAAALLGGAVVTNLHAFGAVREWILAWANPEAALDAAVTAQAAPVVAVFLSALLGACLYAAVSRPGATPLALLVYFIILIASYALKESLAFGLAVPGLIGALAAFVLSGELPRDAGAWRALIPVGLAVILALILVPAGRMTWEPMENAAKSIRAVFEDYFRFTHERIPFTINTEGYNHAAEVGGQVRTRLGGPANPSEEAVMRVTANENVLLRGTIRRTYTGYSWEDADAKARYLFYDFTRGHVREKLFSMEENGLFNPVNVSVQFLKTGTSSLFVPSRLNSFDMDMENALYYNSIGEMFLSRQTELGDHYALTGGMMGDRNLLRQAVIDGSQKEDEHRQELLEDCLQLPDTIEQGVYALTLELTRNCENDYDRVAAIESWLRGTCAYTLTPDYPDYDRDFVSQFILDEREGYCSYFASAMTVMCRIAGVPARYVEGYSVKAGQDVLLTGEDAHAWTEVYFANVGWVSFDPSNGAGGGSDGLSNDHSSDEPQSTPEPTPKPTATPTPVPPDDATPPPQDDMQGDPTPTPEATATPDPFGSTATPEPPEQNNWPDVNKTRQDSNWTWIILVILAILILLALIALWVYARLAATDPLRLSAKAQTANQAALILYRSILTLLAQTSFGPMSGETPGVFARRVCAQVKNPDFIAFADAVALAAYSRDGMTKQTVDLGRNAYRAFEKGLKKSERMKFMLTRILRGLGEFESIP